MVYLPLFFCSGMESGYALLHKDGIDGKHMPEKGEVKSWKTDVNVSLESKNKWHIFHAGHTMTGLEEMSEGYGWRRD